MVQTHLSIARPVLPFRRSCSAFSVSSPQGQQFDSSPTVDWGRPVWEQHCSAQNQAFLERRLTEILGLFVRTQPCKLLCSAVSQDRFSKYTSKLCEEIAQQQRLNAQPLRTVFFGGGTPSLIPPQRLASILETLHNRVGIDPEAEISMEADPGTFDAARLQEYMRLGVTRFSVGVQSFNEGVLQGCGRSHTVQDVHEAIAAVNAAAPQSWSLDLISGLPGVTVDVWEDTLQEAINYSPPHISVYDLQVEEGTPFGRWDEQGSLELPNEDSSVQQWMSASSMLRSAGYEHYELSNYSKPGHACKHNLMYWLGHSYYAFGMGASSYIQGKRFTRPRKLKYWEEYVDGLAEIGSTDARHDIAIDSDPKERLLDAIMLGLRTRQGVDMHWLHNNYGETCVRQVLKALPAHIDAGRAELVQGDEMLSCQKALESLDSGRCKGKLAVRLTDPSGFLTSNDIISDVFLHLNL